MVPAVADELAPRMLSCLLRLTRCAGVAVSQIEDAAALALLTMCADDAPTTETAFAAAVPDTVCPKVEVRLSLLAVCVGARPHVGAAFVPPSRRTAAVRRCCAL